MRMESEQPTREVFLFFRVVQGSWPKVEFMFLGNNTPPPPCCLSQVCPLDILEDLGLLLWCWSQQQVHQKLGLLPLKKPSPAETNWPQRFASAFVACSVLDPPVSPSHPFCPTTTTFYKYSQINIDLNWVSGGGAHGCPGPRYHQYARPDTPNPDSSGFQMTRLGEVSCGFVAFEFRERERGKGGVEGGREGEREREREKEKERDRKKEK